jgi:hypothetical protein
MQVCKYFAFEHSETAAKLLEYMATEVEFNVTIIQLSGSITAAHLQQSVHVQLLPAVCMDLYPIRVLRVFMQRATNGQPARLLGHLKCNLRGPEMPGIVICQLAIHQTAASDP